MKGSARDLKSSRLKMNLERNLHSICTAATSLCLRLCPNKPYHWRSIPDAFLKQNKSRNILVNGILGPLSRYCNLCGEALAIL